MDHPTIQNLTEGREQVEDLQAEIRSTFASMQGKTGVEWEKLNEKHYELIQKKRSIQSQLGQFVKNAQRSTGLPR
jgi:hypothetical protein